MEYTGFQVFGDDQYYSTSSAPQSDYKSSHRQAWNPSIILDSYSTSTFLTDENIENSREPKYGVVDSLLRASTGQNFGFYEGKNFMQHSASDLLDARIKDEGSDNSPKLSEMTNYPGAVSEQHSLISLNEPTHSFFPGRHLTGKDHSAARKHIDGRISVSKGYNYCGISSSSISTTPDLPADSCLVSCSLGSSSQTLDLHTIYGAENPCLRLYYDHTFGLNEESMRLSNNNMQGQQNSPSNSSNKLSAHGAPRTRRPANCFQPKESSEVKAKKLKPSCPPLKVGKEKLGDRIQTLQRLAAPFGKTDTASVLTEAIGYIHFLHDQIQTLSIPYMKSSPSQPSAIMQLESKKEDGRKTKTDLRSRGICLVPISYASFINPCV